MAADKSRLKNQLGYLVPDRKPNFSTKVVPAEPSLMRMAFFPILFWVFTAFKMRAILILKVHWAELSRRLCSQISLLISGCFLVRSAFSLGRLVFPRLVGLRKPPLLGQRHTLQTISIQQVNIKGTEITFQSSLLAPYPIKSIFFKAD